MTIYEGMHTLSKREINNDIIDNSYTYDRAHEDKFFGECERYSGMSEQEYIESKRKQLNVFEEHIIEELHGLNAFEEFIVGHGRRMYLATFKYTGPQLPDKLQGGPYKKLFKSWDRYPLKVHEANFEYDSKKRLHWHLLISVPKAFLRKKLRIPFMHMNLEEINNFMSWRCASDYIWKECPDNYYLVHI